MPSVTHNSIHYHTFLLASFPRCMSLSNFIAAQIWLRGPTVSPNYLDATFQNTTQRFFALDPSSGFLSSNSSKGASETDVCFTGGLASRLVNGSSAVSTCSTDTTALYRLFQAIADRVISRCHVTRTLYTMLNAGSTHLLVS